MAAQFDQRIAPVAVGIDTWPRIRGGGQAKGRQYHERSTAAACQSN